MLIPLILVLPPYNGRQSHYTHNMIIDEDRSMPLPTFIRTGDSYFAEKEHHLNSMVKAKGLPTLPYPWLKLNGFI